MQHPFFNTQSDIPGLPTDQVIAIYVRQSVVPSRVASEHHYTVDDLVTFAKTLGFSDERIVLICHESGNLGNALAEQRLGLARICEAIQENNIKVILIQQEISLFRATEGIDVSQFIALCQEHCICIITPQEVYHFSNNIDCMRFRCQIEQRGYYVQFTTSTLLSHKKRAALAGYYDGRPVPLGYIVDRRRAVNGQLNPMYRKLIPYEPHAEIICNIFRQYVESAGSIDDLYQQIQSAPVLFPLFAEWVDPQSRSKFPLKQVDNSYIMTRDSLARLLHDPNPVYIGIWVYKGHELMNNHEPIVPYAIFRQAQAFSPKYQRYLQDLAQNDHSAG